MLNINKSIKISILCVFCFCTLALNAQKADTFEYYTSAAPRFLPSSGDDTLIYALAGGLNAPQFNTIDLNDDGILDLMIFDRHGDRTMTFINKGTQGKVDYYYAPAYEQLLPHMENWVATRDYDDDGDMDIFTGNNGDIVIYINTTSNGYLSFSLRTESLKAKLWGPSPPLDTTRVFVSISNYPAIDDIDNDGDLDFISFPATGGYLEMYKNYDVERGLPPGTMQLELADFCWGCFTEGANTNTVNLGACKREWAPKYYKKRHVSGTTILPIDLNGDGDKDLLMGNGSFTELLRLDNVKSDIGWDYDSMIAYSALFPANTTPAHVDLFPAAFYIDVNNDGEKDLIVAASGRSNISEVNEVLYYKNTGTTANPVFEYVQDNFMQQYMIDFGGATEPLFWDYDDDGDKDLFVANNYNYAVTENKSDRLAFYENIGDENRAIYRLIEEDFLLLSKDSIQSMSPTMGDLNDDGKPDLLIGTSSGDLRYYLNTTTGSTPTFSLQSATYQSINVTAFASPYIVDLNQDDLLDLVIGCYGGNIFYYKNIGTKASPSFILEDDTLGNFIVNRYRSDINPPGYEKQGNSSPVVADINRDGILDIVVGSAEGKVRIFTNIDPNDLTKDFTEVDTFFFHEADSSFHEDRDWGHFTTPEVADINNDSTLDIIFGNRRGGLMYLSSIKDNSKVSTGKAKPRIQTFKAYPNPASNQLTVSREFAKGNVDYTITNSLGQTMINGNFGNNNLKETIDITTLPAGIYFVSFTADDSYSYTLRISVAK